MSDARDQEERIARSWRVNADAWSDAVRNRRIASRGAGTDAAIVEAVLRANPASVLDLGCGEGWLVRALAARGIEAVGIDASPELVAAARASGGARFECASYRELACAPSTRPFDVVVFNFALFGEDLAEPLRAARARLRPRGTLVVQTLHPHAAAVGDAPVEGWRVEDFCAIGGDFREPMPWYFRTLESWYTALCDAGFARVRVEEPRDAHGAVLSLLLSACADADATSNYTDRAPAA